MMSQRPQALRQKLGSFATGVADASGLEPQANARQGENARKRAPFTQERHGAPLIDTASTIQPIP
ncbi:MULTISPECIES: hypothetical protein [Chromobacterium]|uniref:hypothetical protein n=1 Tax=Chromobacterium TaxID=535 RepID=UPI001888AA80|nr:MULTISPECIES: hypothetical protein [Chromobacterium]WON82545.1 hypothetical protein OK026_15455 [Chromobacterium haemolyticum]